VPSSSHSADRFMVPYSENKRFMGRDDLLSSLSSLLREERPYQFNHRVALYGLGGVGKTQTALAYLYSSRSQYDWIFWISGATQTSLLSDFRRIGSLTKCECDEHIEWSQCVRKVHQWLNAQTSWLLARHRRRG